MREECDTSGQYLSSKVLLVEVNRMINGVRWYFRLTTGESVRACTGKFLYSQNVVKCSELYTGQFVGFRI